MVYWSMRVPWQRDRVQVSGCSDIRGLDRLCGLDRQRQSEKAFQDQSGSSMTCCSWRPLPFKPVSGPVTGCCMEKLLYELYRVPRDGFSTEAKPVTLETDHRPEIMVNLS